MSDTTFLISGGFFDAVDSDRLYSADQMNQPYKKLIHDGINREADGTTPGFAVTAGGGMNVLVATGNAMIGGKWAENKAVQTIAVAGNTSGSARIDSVILQCDKSRAVRAVQIVYRQGTAAAPDLVSDDDITELRLANIRVPSAASAIASENITDTRGGAECPWVRSVFDAPDARYIVEEYTGTELAGAHQTVKSAVDSIRYAAQSGQPTVALQASDMIDSNKVYLYQGNETGYSAGYLYYYSDAAGAWIRGAQYGASIVDTALDADSENPVQNKAVTAAVAGLNGRLTQQGEDITELQNGGYVADQQQIEAKLNAWLNDHPDATTTVQDGSLTESKFSDALELKTIKDYVTPEMYGAKGDGSTDDTTAIQSAINSGKPVVLLNKTYRTNTKITVSDGCPAIRSYGLIKYYGNDYALEFVACRDKTYHLGRIEARTGGCVLLDSSNGYIQYLNFYFVNFKALTNCVYVKIPSSWINEIRFFNGMFFSGNYGVYAENSTAAPENHYIFSEIGFEGVTTGIYLAGAFSNVACYGCRMEESTTNLLETDASTLSHTNSFLWYGLLRMSFTNNAKRFPIYCFGPIYNTDGALISYKGVIVDGLFYGDVIQWQYYLGRWNAENPVKTITNANVLNNGTVFRYAPVNLEQECVIEIEKTAFYLSGMFNMPIYILGDIAANHTLIVRTTDGVTLATYTPTSDVYNRLIKIHYLGNWGIVLQEMPKMTRVEV